MKKYVSNKLRDRFQVLAILGGVVLVIISLYLFMLDSDKTIIDYVLYTAIFKIGLFTIIFDSWFLLRT